MKLDVFVQKLKKDIDVPLMSEKLETKILDKLVKRVTPKVEPAFRRCVPECYVDCMQYVLDEEMHVKTRRAQISEILQEKIGTPLAKELSADTNIKFEPSKIENAFMKTLAKKFVEDRWRGGKNV